MTEYMLCVTSINQPVLNIRSELLDGYYIILFDKQILPDNYDLFKELIELIEENKNNQFWRLPKETFLNSSNGYIYLDTFSETLNILCEYLIKKGTWKKENNHLIKSMYLSMSNYKEKIDSKELFIFFKKEKIWKIQLIKKIPKTVKPDHYNYRDWKYEKVNHYHIPLFNLKNIVK